MDELRDTDLNSLFQTAGYESPGTDLTARIMARVAVTPVLRPTKVEPLIGTWGWVGICGVLLAVVLSVLFFGMASGGTGGTYLSPIREFFSGMELLKGNWPLWMIGMSFLALLFMGIDRALDRSGI